MFFESWGGLGRVLVVGALAYIALVVLLRISGKRTLSKLNAFDLVVTVALGSTLATVLLSKDVPLLEGILAFGLLISAQYIITALSVRSAAVRRFVKSEPRLLYHNGRMLDDALRKERVTENEILAVARASGYADLAKVGAVILETDGSFDVIGQAEAPESPTLKDVQGPGKIG
ncbi:DUF421 domain-containing protein [Pseudomonas sp. gcc21]|uniref:DUF421 domain-containing protein n=1 Tax=Pseudomonas sp. gcc21 TaxID=2726989 RepID=UPI00145229E5|nr:YetF domain-containing protein [Pseudomonas sp. gcc21]QJD60268.1 DUF421 domain-containing protein [Pseudomonas sp. gcc21]